MPKIETIIQSLHKAVPLHMPEILQVSECDDERINEALKVKNATPNYYGILRVLQSAYNRKYKHESFLEPFGEINPKDLDGDIAKEFRLIISEAIIEAEYITRAKEVDNHLSNIIKEYLPDLECKLRFELIRAGSQCMKGNYYLAAMHYLIALREEAVVHDEARKIGLFNKSIAYVFMAPATADSRKLICTLCMNQLRKKSPLNDILSKLYLGGIITEQEEKCIAGELPKRLLSKTRNAKLSHNMVPIVSTFSVISFQTLCAHLGVDELALLVFLEETYSNGEVTIDQVSKHVHVHRTRDSEAFLRKLDSILVMS